MDSAKTITHISLCAGYGGIDLGLKRAIPNLRTIAFSEIEAYACSNLVSKMEKGLLDAAPIWTNIKTFPWAKFCGKVDILSGGYPCQPFSSAGKRLGKDDPRHLWPYIANGIRSMQPRVCFFENVEGHITLGLREVIRELEQIGYRATWGIFSAREVGAPHRRKRIFIMAYAMCYGSPESWKLCQRSNGQESSSDEQQRRTNFTNSDSERHDQSITRDRTKERSLPMQTLTETQQSLVWSKTEGCSESLGDSLHDGYSASKIGESSNEGKVAGQTEQITTRQSEGSSSSSGGNEPLAYDENELHNANCENVEGYGNDACGVQTQYPVIGDPSWWKTERGLGRVANGHPYWVDRLRLCGNGVVPATAELAFRTLWERLK
jgi:DNA (cytosine-5)-methyltransferase 1